MRGFEIFHLGREKGNVRNKINKPKRRRERTTILESESAVSEDLKQIWISIEKPNVKSKIIVKIY